MPCSLVDYWYFRRSLLLDSCCLSDGITSQFWIWMQYIPQSVSKLLPHYTVTHPQKIVITLSINTNTKLMLNIIFLDSICYSLDKYPFLLPFHLISPTSSGRSVSIVCLRTKTTEFVFVFFHGNCELITGASYLYYYPKSRTDSAIGDI
jgi:hypothetical protein